LGEANKNYNLLENISFFGGGTMQVFALLSLYLGLTKKRCCRARG
jgi:hypothetical protein